MLIIWQYLKNNLIFISFHLLCIPHIISIFYDWEKKEILFIMLNITIIIILLFLSYYKNSGFRYIISIKDLIKLNRNKNYQYQKLIKEEKYYYIKYIKYVDKDTQLKIYNKLNEHPNILYTFLYRQEKYLKELINPCYDLVNIIILNKPILFHLINKNCNNYKEYEELYKFMTI